MRIIIDLTPTVLAAMQDAGCGDSGCAFGDRGGQRTNGGCRCFAAESKETRRAARALVALVARAIREQEQK
jgi:hypothetical protein